MIPKNQTEAAQKLTVAYIEEVKDGTKAPVEVAKDLRASAKHAKTPEAKAIFEEAIATVEGMT